MKQIAAIKMIDNDILFFTFPPEITLSSAITCTAEGFVKTASCSLVSGTPNRLQAKVTFNGGSVNANT